MRIILVRHGETDENAAGCYLGHTDAKLNSNGRQQLRRLIDSLKELDRQNTSSLYSSDLSRAMESAHIIGEELQFPPISVFSLRELNFGDWECKTYAALNLQEKEQLEKWIQDPFSNAPPNGETLLELGKRFDDWFLQRLSNTEPNETIMVVSHGGPIRWFLSKWIIGDAKEFWNVEGVGHGKGLVVEYNERTRMFTLMNKVN